MWLCFWMPWMSRVFSVMILSLARSHSCPGEWPSTSPLPLSPPTGACAHQNKSNFPRLALPQTYFHREMGSYLLLTYPEETNFSQTEIKALLRHMVLTKAKQPWLRLAGPVCLHPHLDLRVSPYKAISCISCFLSLPSFAEVREPQV